MAVRRASFVLLSLGLVAACRLDLTRQLQPGELRGRLTFERIVDGAVQTVPAAGAVVRVANSTITVKADATGRFVLRRLGVPRVSLSMQLDLDDDGIADGQLGLRNLEVSSFDPGLGAPRPARDLGALRLSVAGTIEGRVVLDGVPVPGAVLTAVDEAGVEIAGIPVVRADGNGRYRFPVVPAGSLAVRATFERGTGTAREVLTSTSAPVEVSPRAAVSVALSLQPPRDAVAGSLGASVASFEGVETVDLVLVDASGGTQQFTDVSANPFAVPSVEPGVYTVVVSAVGYEPVTLENVVVDGDVELDTVFLAQQSGDGPRDCNGDGVVACAADPDGTCDVDDDSDGTPDAEEAKACSCGPGVRAEEGSPVCLPPPPCLAAACDENADCSENGSIATCTCRQGFSGDGVTCVPLQQCPPNAPLITSPLWDDTDNDGVGAGQPVPTPHCTDVIPPGKSDVGGDCDDTNPWIPGAFEIANNGLDDDCEGGDLENVEARAPGRVSDLRAGGYCDTVKLRWGPPADPGDSPVRFYEVQSFSPAAQEWRGLRRIDVIAGQESLPQQFFFTDLDRTVTHRLRAIAVSASGYGDITQEVVASTCGGVTCADLYLDGNRTSGPTLVRPSKVPDAAEMQAFCDMSESGRGRTLVAHYLPGTRHSAYDPGAPQQLDDTGGTSPAAGWFPTPTDEASGHLSFDAFDPAGRDVILECGTSAASITRTVSSSTLFTSFSDGTYGNPSATGEPGWGVIAAIGSGEARSGHAMCGTSPELGAGGFAYCSGPGIGGSFSNHLVSFYSTAGSDSPYVGCGGLGCNGPTCNLHVWAWVR